MLLLLTLFACGTGPSSAPAGAAADQAFTLEEVKATTFRPEISLAGSLEPVASVQLGFDVPGRIASLEVQRGQAVADGEALARLDSAMASAQLAQAEAAVAGAEAQLAAGEAAFQRATAMHEAKGLSDQQFQEAQAAVAAGRAGVEQARAAARLARTNVAFHTLKSPIAGVVSAGPDNAGAVVGAGTPLFVIDDLSALQIKTTAPETATWLNPGLHATVSSGAGSSADALVTRVLPALDPATRRIPVELRIEQPPAGLRAHAFARAKILADADAPAWNLPAAAVVARPEFSVFTLPKGAPDTQAPTRIPVSIVRQEGDRMVVAGALVEGDRVVLDPPTTLGAE